MDQSSIFPTHNPVLMIEDSHLSHRLTFAISCHKMRSIEVAQVLIRCCYRWKWLYEVIEVWEEHEGKGEGSFRIYYYKWRMKLNVRLELQKRTICRYLMLLVYISIWGHDSFIPNFNYGFRVNGENRQLFQGKKKQATVSNYDQRIEQIKRYLRIACWFRAIW